MIIAEQGKWYVTVASFRRPASSVREWRHLSFTVADLCFRTSDLPLTRLRAAGNWTRDVTPTDDADKTPKIDKLFRRSGPRCLRLVAGGGAR